MEPSQINQKRPEQAIGRARNQGNTEHVHVGHCTRTSESTYKTWEITLHVPQIVTTKQLQHYVT